MGEPKKKLRWAPEESLEKVDVVERYLGRKGKFHLPTVELNRPNLRIRGMETSLSTGRQR